MAFSAAVSVIEEVVLLAGAAELCSVAGETAEAKPMVTGLELWDDDDNEIGLEAASDAVDLTKVVFELGLLEIRRDEEGFATAILAVGDDVVVDPGIEDEADEISLDAWYGFEELKMRVLMIGVWKRKIQSCFMVENIGQGECRL